MGCAQRIALIRQAVARACHAPGEDRASKKRSFRSYREDGGGGIDRRPSGEEIFTDSARPDRWQADSFRQAILSRIREMRAPAGHRGC